MKKKLSALITAAVMVFGIAGAVTLSGCGTAELAYTLSDDGTHYIVSVSGSPSALTEADILEEYEGLPVTEISALAFYGCTNLTTVTMPDSITKIGSSAFAYCSKLQSVMLSQSLTEIPYGAFASCTLLSGVVLHEGITGIGALAFFDCTSLTEITLPQSLTAIGSRAFYRNYLYGIEIPDSVTEMGENAFYSGYQLSSVKIGDGLTSLAAGVFGSCTQLSEVYMTASVTEIAGTDEDAETYSSFYYCYSITDIYYDGTDDEWEAIAVGEDNDYFSAAEVHTNYQW